MSLSQALNQFAQNLGRYRRIPESVRITPVDNGMHRHGPSFRVIGLIRVLDTVMRGRSPAQTAAIALMHLLTILRKIRAENIRHCIAPK